MNEPTLTPADRTFLSRRLHGFLSVAGGPTPAQPRPVWFDATAEGTIEFFTIADSPKVRRLRADPRASLVVAAPADERERWIAVTGHVTFADDGARELATRLASRYWDLEDRSADLTAMLAEDNVRVVLHPDSVSRFAF